MNFLKRAFTSIIRKPGKSAILLVLVFILCNVIAGAVSVKNALNMTKRSLLEKMGAEVRVTVDYDWIYNSGEDFDWSMLQDLDIDVATKLSASKYVKRTDFTVSTSLEGEGLCYPDSPVGEDYSYNAWFQITGGNLPTLKEEENNNIRITDGRCYTAEEIESGASVILVSAKCAERNNLSIGDTITLMQHIYQYNYETWEFISDFYVKKEFTVIGIFSSIPKADTDSKVGEGYDTYDQYMTNMYTTTTALTDFQADVKKAGTDAGMPEDEANLYLDVAVSFMIDSIDNIEIFETENKGLLPIGYTFSDNSEKLSDVAKPMDNMKLIANIILYVAVGATVLVIGLLVTLFLKDRIREMGIYLSLGERKLKVALQILTEVMTVAVIAVSLSIFSGNILAKQLSAGLLADQLDGSSSNQYIIYDYGYGGNVSGDDVMDEYTVALNGSTIGFIYLIGLGSVFVSTTIPVAFTLRLNPRKILL